MTDNLTILKELKAYLQKGYNNSVKDVILFGSQLKGSNSIHSDYDVLIVLSKDFSTHDENSIYDLCYDIDLKYNIVIDAHLISQKDISTLKGKQPIFINALNSGLYA